MMQRTIIKQTAKLNRSVTPLRKSAREIQAVLRETAGLWRGRELNPIAYQRKMRKMYATVQRKRG